MVKPWETQQAAQREAESRRTTTVKRIAAEHDAAQQARAFASQLISSLDAAAEPPSLWPLHRAAEHLVLDVTTAKPTAGSIGLASDLWRPVIETGLRTELGVLAHLPLVSMAASFAGLPILPSVEWPTVGTQNGEKKDLPSDAFTVGRAANPVTIDASLTLNVSLQLEVTLPGAVEMFVRSAVVQEAERQLLAGFVAHGTAAADLGAGLDAVGAHWRPTLVVVPGKSVVDHAAALSLLRGMGLDVVTAPVTKPLVVAAAGVAGYLLDVQQVAVEPSVFGRSIGLGIFGAVAASPGSVAVIG
jgi:hypothetical protein